MNFNRFWLMAAVATLIVVIDQIIKIYVKTHFFLGESVEVLPWFYLDFVQNNGMAFGWQLTSKYFLTFARIVMVCLLGWYLYRISSLPRIKSGYVLCIAMITAGALGNIIDCVFYGEIFTNPTPPAVAVVTPVGQGYGSWFQGLVVDMFHFPLFSFNWPGWIPVIGGQHFSFFDPVFNFADASISVGMIAVLLFYRKYIGPVKDYA